MKEKQIEVELREQMLALESQMKRLQEWRDTRYSATVCADDMHNWVETESHRKYDVINGNIHVVFTIDICQVCGLEKFSRHELENEQFSDMWSEFRECGEEE